MAKATTVTLESRIEQSLIRLAAHNNELSLTVTQLVSPCASLRTAVNRKEVNTKVTVDVDSHCYTSWSNSASNGLCIRMIFGGYLYATCGNDAEKLKKWAEEVFLLDTKETPPPFPDICFQQVSEEVKLRNEEIIMA